MKPCARNRKLIAWLALDALPARKAAALRKHLARCEGCHRYWEEVSSVMEGLAATAPCPELEASEHFHRRLTAKLRAVESSSGLEDLAAWLRGSMPSWRVALPALALALSALLAVVASRQHPAVAPSRPLAVETALNSASGSDLAPTLANYRMVANQSLENLSELLTRQGNRPLPPAPVYTVSGLEPAKAQF
jgi:hypothetical protein